MKHKLKLYSVLPALATILGAAYWLTRPEKDLLARSIRLTPDKTTYMPSPWPSRNEIVYVESHIQIGANVVRLDVLSRKTTIRQVKVYEKLPSLETEDLEERQLIDSQLGGLWYHGIYAAFGHHAFGLFDSIEPIKVRCFAAVKDESSSEWIVLNDNLSTKVIPTPGSKRNEPGSHTVETPPSPQFVGIISKSVETPPSTQFVGIRTKPAEIIALIREDTARLPLKDKPVLISIRNQRGRPVITKHPLWVRGGECIADLALSPDGKKLAWIILRQENSSRTTRWLADHCKFIRADVRYVADLALSNSDGNDRRLIATMEYEPVNGTAFDWPITCTYCPDLLMWRPDGHYVSFNHKGAVWMTKVD